MRVVSVVVVACLMMPWAVAQNAEAPDPGPEAMTLYLHTNSGDTVLWMNTLESDGADDYVTVASATAPLVESSKTITFDLMPAASVPITLDPDGTVGMDIVWGQGTGSAARASVAVTLRSDDTTVASASSGIQNRLGSYSKSSLSAAPEVESLPAGAPLSLDVKFTGSGSILVSVGGAASSLVQLPILEPATAPETTVRELNGTDVLDFGNVTEPVQYAFAPAAGDRILRLAANLTAGNVTYRLVSPANETAAEGILNGTAEHALDVPGDAPAGTGGPGNGTADGNNTSGGNGTADGNSTAGGNGTADGNNTSGDGTAGAGGNNTSGDGAAGGNGTAAGNGTLAGNWSLEIVPQDTNGTLHLLLENAPAPPPINGTASPLNGTDPNNGTEELQDDAGKDSPAPALGVVAVAAAAVWRRRIR